MYISYKKKTRENVSPLWNETREQVTQDSEKAKELNATFDNILHKILIK